MDGLGVNLDEEFRARQLDSSTNDFSAVRNRVPVKQSSGFRAIIMGKSLTLMADRRRESHRGAMERGESRSAES